jgi:hypothetical protein
VAGGAKAVVRPRPPPQYAQARARVLTPQADRFFDQRGDIRSVDRESAMPSA